MKLLVLGDSLCYYGPDEALPIDDQRLWVNQLDAEVSVFAGLGWTLRDAFWAVTDNPSVWAQLPQVDAVVIAVGGMDSLPSPLPTYLRQGIRYLRPDLLRRSVRAGYLRLQPRLSRVSTVPVVLPPKQSALYAEKLVTGLRSLRPELKIVGTLPSRHRADSYARRHPGWRPQVAALGRVYQRLGVSTVDLAAVTARFVLGGEGNVDGIHWGWQAHREVAKAVRAELTT